MKKGLRLKKVRENQSPQSPFPGPPSWEWHLSRITSSSNVPKPYSTIFQSFIQERLALITDRAPLELAQPFENAVHSPGYPE